MRIPSSRRLSTAETFLTICGTVPRQGEMLGFRLKGHILPYIVYIHDFPFRL